MSMKPLSADVSLSDSEAVTTDGWRRLSPKMLLVHPVKEIGRALPALIAVLFAGSQSGDGYLWGLVGAGVVTALSLSRWFTTRFRISTDQVQIREGLLRRRTMAARIDRVRTVDVTSHALHRALGLARVEIGTGVSDRKGRSILRLDGLTAHEAARLRGELLHRIPDARPVPAVEQADASGGRATVADPTDPGRPWPRPAAGSEQEVEIASMRPQWIRFAPFTLSGVFTGLAVAAFGWRIVSEGQVDVGRVGAVHSVTSRLDSTPLWLSILEVTLAAVVFVAVASTLGYVLSYWNFRLTRHSGGTFHVSRGLLTTRATSIDVSRLRGVTISESFLVRLNGGARAVAVATGLDVRRNNSSNRGGTVLLPDAPLGEARRVADTVLARPGLASTALIAHGETARRRRYTRALGGALVLVGAVGAAWWVFGGHGLGWLGALVVLPVAGLLAADRSHNLGHAMVDGFLVSQAGSITRRRVLLDADSIIGWNIRQSFFQRRSGVATLIATTAAGRQSYRLLDLTPGEARRVADEAVPGLLDAFTASVAGEAASD